MKRAAIMQRAVLSSLLLATGFASPVWPASGAVTALRAAAGLDEANPLDIIAADTDNDGTLTLADALFLARSNNVLLADFEGADYGGWTATGDAFGSDPAQGTLPNQQAVSGYLGHGLVNTFRNGDGATGTLTSPPFTISRRYINFLLGGGAHPGETGVNLLVDGRAVRTETGSDNERLSWWTWDVSDLAGKTARLQIVDNATGGWGHINVDEVTMSDMPRNVLYGEAYRPQFHFSAARFWLNDPNGLVYNQGEYHLFFQHNPTGNEWGNMHWGHAVSTDLVHWRQLPIALAPDALGTIFSGSAVVDTGNTGGFQTGGEPPMVALYTSAGEQSTQSLAYSNDQGRTWAKYAGNPVVPVAAPGNRDPRVFWHAPSGRWVMALYLDGNRYTFYTSPNLKDWTRGGDVTLPGSTECPDIFELPVDGNPSNTRWVFVGGDGGYMLGAFDGRSFQPQTGRLLSDWGANFYATQTYNDIPADDGRRIQIAWMPNAGAPGMPFKGQMTFPCVLTLKTFPNGIRLCRAPVAELSALRAEPHPWSDLMLHPGENPLSGLSGDLFDIEAEFAPGATGRFGFRIRGTEVSWSAADGAVTCLGRTAALPVLAGRVKLRVLVDRCSIEVFGNDGQVSLSSCFVPPLADRSLAVFADGAPVRITSLDVYPLRSAWTRG